METSEVNFYAREGVRLAGLWRTPDAFDAPLRAIVQGPGWLGLKDANLYVRYHEALTAAGFGVLIFDYRGFGDSEGPRELLSPLNQVNDITHAVTYLTTRDDVDPEAIGAFGSGGTGGGNAVIAAAQDDRIGAVVSQLPVADGEDWLHRMRSEDEWLAFLDDLEQDRKDRVATGKGRYVNPREEIMVPTAERRQTSIKSDVDDRIPTEVSLESADLILKYKPVDAARNLTTPLMVIAVEGDATTPTDHATAIYEAASAPKLLVMQRHTTHYAAYDQYWHLVTPEIVSWFDRHLGKGDVLIRHQTSGGETIEFRSLDGD